MYSDNRENPFADRVDDHTYHAEAIREKRLNLILHLASYSAVLLIQGESGSGKTTFLNRLREQSQSNWVVCRINGGPGFDKPMLYHALFRVFTSGIPLEDEDHPDESLALLVRELAALRHEHRIPVLIIDDADHLPETALETLEELLVMDGGNEDLLSIILSAEPGFEAKLVESSLQTFKNRISHVFDLPAFSEQDTSEYIHLRLSAAGLEEGNPFTPSAMHLIHTSSKGIPGRINDLAQQILAKEKKPRPPRVDAPKTTAPAPLRVEARPIAPRPKRASANWGRIALGIVLIPILGLLFFQDSINHWLERKPETQSETVQLPAPEKPVELAAAPPAPTAAKPKPVAPPQRPAPVVVAPEPEIAPAEAIDEMPTPETSAPSDDDTAALPIEEETSTRPATPLTTAKPEPVAPPPPNETAEVGEIPEAETPVTAATTAPEPVADRNSEWLTTSPEDHFTLQLVAMSPEGAKRFVDRYALGDELHTFKRIRNGKTLVVLIYGDYSTKAEAQAASTTLAERIKGLKPWIRPIAAFRKDIQPDI